LNKSFLEVLICQQDVDKWQDIEVEKDRHGADELIGEHVSAKQELDSDDKEDVGHELDQPRPEGHVDVDEVLLSPSSNDIWKSVC